MSIALIVDTPGMTQDQYEIAHRLLSNNVEPKALVHIAGPTERGWRIVEVWPSQEAATQFFSSTRVRQAYEAAEIAPTQATIFPVFALYASPLEKMTRKASTIVENGHGLEQPRP